MGWRRTPDRAVWVIWALFILDSGVRLLIAPDRAAFLRSQWLTILALPALRILRVAAVFRFLRAAGAVRSVGLLRVVTSLNRGLATLGRVADRRGLRYLVAATALVIVVGAAAMTPFERGEAPSGSQPDDWIFDDYAGELWWTASTKTTGPSEQPRSPEGRDPAPGGGRRWLSSRGGRTREAACAVITWPPLAPPSGSTRRDRASMGWPDRRGAA